MIGETFPGFNELASLEKLAVTGTASQGVVTGYAMPGFVVENPRV
jgi:hypothetical protein